MNYIRNKAILAADRRSALRLAVLATLAISVTNGAFAGSATWNLNPVSGNWNHAANWTPATIPNGASDIATFGSSSKTNVSISADTTVDGIIFNSGASPFTITASSGLSLTIVGAGITNNSATEQDFVAASDVGVINFGNNATASNYEGDLIIAAGGASSGESGGEINFSGASRAGNGTFGVEGGAVSNSFGAQMFFFNIASADTAGIRANGGSGSGATGGQVLFSDQSTAGNAFLSAVEGSNGGAGGTIEFLGKSHGGTAEISVFGTGTLRIDHHSLKVPQVTIGALAGNGNVILSSFGTGPGKNLAVGSNNLSFSFSGLIDDGGFGGSITKIGHASWTLYTGNTYTGGTTIKQGNLIVRNDTGSATGTGPVQINRGTLSGIGFVSGPVTVGTGTAAATLAPGLPGINSLAFTLTLRSTVQFNSKSRFKVGANSTHGICDKLVAKGVTISSGAQFFFTDHGSGTLTAGTVFTVINNTSATPIAGTFINLPDGSIFTSNGNNFKANYQGGDGNDLTLKVVP